MRIKLATPLIGEFPRYANVKLHDNAALIVFNGTEYVIYEDDDKIPPEFLSE